ncbi:phage tail protein [Laribacter hongkongensis]|uniref:phage tail protein n=1 Tax=Laribacter hongkongensis TaxID=168471 RepID=UPI001EFD4A7B|nr:phage tail protein [Laribacter hongkongensis]MCG9080361.1 phage tail protein [Laribacter hongkongensis]
MNPLIPPIGTADSLFHDGNPATGELGTIVSAEWLNNMQAALRGNQTELIALLTAAGIEPNAAKVDQVLTALRGLFLGKAAQAADSAKLEGHPASYFAKADDLAKVGGDPLLWPRTSPSRTHIQAGYAPLDGQELSRALYPDAWAAIQAGAVPVVTEAEWQTDPLKRGAWTYGNGTTTFRMPDWNGKSAGSKGAVFVRGDGALSAGTPGLIQGDAMQGHGHDLIYSYTGMWGGSLTSALSTTGSSNILENRAAAPISLSGYGSVRIASETRPLNVTGVWVCRLFGAVTNPGATDASQLATEVARLWSQKAERQSVLGAGYMLVCDERASGTTGGASVVGTQVRTLNTVRANTIAGAALSGNQITLPAGTYRIRAKAPTIGVNNTQAWLYNVTDTSIPVRGTSENGQANNVTDPMTISSFVEGRFTITGAKVLELRQYCNEVHQNGLGAPVSQGTEVYSTVEIIQE